MGINLRQNKIVGSSKHMTDHGSLYGRAIVEGVLMQITDCLPELVAQGVPVQLGNLGTFYPTAEVAKNGAVNDIPDMDGLNPNDIVKAIHIRFLPDATKLDNLCGPKFKDACTLELRNIIDTQEVTVDGKKKKVQTLKPIATAVAEWKAQNGQGGSQGGSSSQGGQSQGGEQGGSQGGSESGSQSQTNFALTITKYGTGTSTVKDDSEQTIASGANVASGSNVNISVVPAES